MKIEKEILKALEEDGGKKRIGNENKLMYSSFRV